MTTEEVVWLIVSGAALGAATRYFLALDIRLHTAVCAGVLALLAGPWVIRNFGGAFADWTISDFAIAAVSALILTGFLRAAAAHTRRRYLRRRHWFLERIQSSYRPSRDLIPPDLSKEGVRVFRGARDSV